MKKQAQATVSELLEALTKLCPEYADAINAIRRLYIAGKNKELGAECVIV